MFFYIEIDIWFNFKLDISTLSTLKKGGGGDDRFQISADMMCHNSMQEVIAP